ncbi:permease [Phycicoccus endophyticus]|uniref:Permease n=1 Tax=Phycicoccus endophyticus TaxID=1690220 RepID=A0A7G9R1L8_9MICO|nr:PfkB family carbohydrate kinase [Phycicoccus endophyticus]NHI18719.1 permease [Phycicoccus endophyticus]QNN49493.1 permease [Phycicoccus endophyticus]GGL36999.1 permease [Phycicoccus endophyticus]
MLTHESAEVVGGGAVAMDDILLIDGLIGDGKGRVIARERRVGGNIAVALVAAARAGARCSFVGRLPDPASVPQILDLLGEEGVDVSNAETSRTTRPIASVVLVGRDGRRFVAYDDETDLGLPTTLDLTVVARAKVLMLDEYGIAGGLRAAEAARDAGVDVVVDIESAAQPESRLLAALSNHLVVPVALATRMTGHASPPDAVNALWREDRTAVIVTDGANGCWYRVGAHVGPPGVHHQPAKPVQVVDTTGCGDVFHGAYAAHLARGATPAQCVAAATEAAAECATHPGGISPRVSGATHRL